MLYNRDGAPRQRTTGRTPRLPVRTRPLAAAPTAGNAALHPYLPPGGLVLHHGSRIHGQPWCRRSASQVSPSGGFTYRSGPGPGRSRGSLAGTAGRGPVQPAGPARGRSRSSVPPAITPAPSRAGPSICQLAARAPARQQARRPSLARTVPPVAGSCSACTGTAGRAGTRGISHGPQVRTGHTSRSSPPLSAR
jgi:hypothetical protein